MNFKASILMLAVATLATQVPAIASETQSSDGGSFQDSRDNIVLAARGHHKKDRRKKVRSKETKVKRTDKGYERSTEITDRQGRHYRRDATVTRDREAGKASRDVVWTGPNGNTASRHDDVTRTDDGYTRNSTFTGPRGNSATRDATVTRDPEAGTASRDVVWTGPRGNTATRHDDVARTDDGYSRSSTFTGPHGNTATRDATVTRDKEAGTRTRDVVWTGPNGNTVTHEDTATRTDDGYMRNQIFTGPQGNSIEREVNATWDPDTKTWSKSVTLDRPSDE